MLSIGRFAKLANVSPRTLRFYESKGLIESSGRSENNYRYYDQTLLARVAQIRNLQELGFSLDEIKDILRISSDALVEGIQRKLSEVEDEFASLNQRREKLKALLSVSNKIEIGHSINDNERTQYMEAIKEQILSNLQAKVGEVSPDHLTYLERDHFYSSPLKLELMNAIHKCVQFAKDRNLRLGPGRGSSPSSIALYALGFTSFNPSSYSLMPERLSHSSGDIWIDVEYERGQAFVDFCRDVSKSLTFGEINAFKMPLIDIIQNVNSRMSQGIEYSEVDDNSELVLGPIRSGDVEKVFGIDMSEDALIMPYEQLLPGYSG